MGPLSRVTFAHSTSSSSSSSEPEPASQAAEAQTAAQATAALSRLAAPLLAFTMCPLAASWHPAAPAALLLAALVVQAAAKRAWAAAWQVLASDA